MIIVKKLGQGVSSVRAVDIEVERIDSVGNWLVKSGVFRM